MPSSLGSCFLIVARLAYIDSFPYSGQEIKLSFPLLSTMRDVDGDLPPQKLGGPCEASGTVEDISVHENGTWLAVASDLGAQLFVAGKSGRRSGKEVLEKGPHQWDYVTTVGSSGGGGAVHGTAWAPSSCYPVAVVVCTEGGGVSLWQFVDALGDFEEVYCTTLNAAGWRVCWAPEDFGKIFAVGAADGSITVFTAAEGERVWLKCSFLPQPQQLGCTGLFFGPFLPSSALLRTPLPSGTSFTSSDLAPLQLVCCHGNSAVLVCERKLRSDASVPPPAASPGSAALLAPSGHGSSAPNLPSATGIGGTSPGAKTLWSETWSVVAELPLSAVNGLDGSPVPAFPSSPTWREVAWAKNAGLPFHYVAAGSEEGFLAIWIHDDQAWRIVFADSGEEVGDASAGKLESGPSAVTRLSWSEVGTFLLVSHANGSVKMWKEIPNAGQWPLRGWEVVTEMGTEEVGKLPLNCR